MTRILPILAALVIAATAGAVVSTGGGASAAQKPAKTAFRQTLAAKLGAQLDRPAEQVLAALKHAAKTQRPAGGKAQRRKRLEDRLRRRLERLESGSKPDRKAATRKARETWAEAVAEPLGLDAAKVTAALRALISERLDSLVSDGWLTTAQRDARLACFDGAPSCKGGAGPGLAFLRVG
jgi:shikimate kinase